MKKLSFVVLIAVSVMLMSCKKTEKASTAITAPSVTEKIEPVIYIEELIEAFEGEGVIFEMIDPATLDENLPDRELYQVAEKIYEFEIQAETGIQADILPPSNEMRTGKIIVFKDNGAMENLVTTLSDQFYIDYLGVDTNYVSPIFVSNPEHQTLLQINQFASPTLAKKYEELFKQVD